MKAIPLPDLDFLLNNFKYENNKLYRKLKSGYKEINNIPGTNGYISVNVDGKKYLLHRIIFKIVNGYDPNIIDHDNGDSLNNDLENLINTNQSKNSMNRKLASNNTSGVVGVVWNKRTSKWEARIKINQVRIFLGRFIDKNDAIKARKDAEIKYNFHPNHGRN